MNPATFAIFFGDFLLIVLFSSSCPCLVSLRENRARSRSVWRRSRGDRTTDLRRCYRSPTDFGHVGRVTLPLRWMNACHPEATIALHIGVGRIAGGYGIPIAEYDSVRDWLGILLHIADTSILVIDIHRVAVNTA